MIFFKIFLLVGVFIIGWCFGAIFECNRQIKEIEKNLSKFRHEHDLIVASIREREEELTDGRKL